MNKYKPLCEFARKQRWMKERVDGIKRFHVSSRKEMIAHIKVLSVLILTGYYGPYGNFTNEDYLAVDALLFGMFGVKP